MYETFFRRIAFPAYETLVKRRGTAGFVADYERSQWLSPEALAGLQLRKLNALLDHCWREVPFLGRYWRDHGCRPGPLESPAALAGYPTITKALITANYAEMIPAAWRGRTLSKTTGGSTGDPFRFEYTMEAYARRTAIMWRGYGWAGAGLGTRTAYLWGTGMRKGGWGAFKDRLYHGAFNRRFFDAFSLSQAGLDGLVDEIERYRPRAVVGYVAPLVSVARHMNAKGRTIAGIRGVLTGAEALYEPERRELERAFGCPAFDTYGSREVMLMASECDRHQGLHVNADHLVLETVDEAGRPVPAGTSGEVAVTDLHNYGMPMVRYLNGDRATYAAGACACGRGLPRLASVDGRVLEMIVTPDGRQVPGEYFVVLMLEAFDVKHWQVVQTAPDAVELRIVTPTPWGPERREKYAAGVRAKAGEAFRVTITEVPDIPKTASGKRRLTVALPKAPPRA